MAPIYLVLKPRFVIHKNAVVELLTILGYSIVEIKTLQFTKEQVTKFLGSIDEGAREVDLEDLAADWKFGILLFFR